MGIFPIEIPTPFRQVSSVNAYLIRGDTCVLVDSGLGTDEGWTVMRTALASLGVSPGDITHVYLTHGHLDHYGLSARIVEESGAAVHIHPSDALKVTADLGKEFESSEAVYRNYFARMGVPGEFMDSMTLIYQGAAILSVQLGSVTGVREGERLLLGDREVAAVGCPGHTPGMVCYYDRTHRILFSGDHLLPGISPNPILEMPRDGSGGKFKGLVEYLKSLEKSEGLDIDLVLPGHGPPIRNHRELIARLRRFYGRRQGKIMKALEKRPRAPFHLFTDLFPGVRDVDIFLAVSEVIGHLEVLEDCGRVAREAGGDGPDGIIRYRLIT